MIFCKIMVVILMAMSLGMHLAKHGEPRTGKYNFWAELFGSTVTLALLWGGGFFG